MIIKDEERFLADCLDHVKHLTDEIIIVDNGSTDRSKEIAARFTDKIFDLPKQGDFSAVRNLSLDKATSNWILVLDADELLSETGMAAVKEIINNKEHCLKDLIGFRMDQRSYNPKGPDAKKTTDAETLRKDFSGFESSKLVRLFRNSPKVRFRNKVHELVEPSIRENNGEILDTDIVIHHFSMLKDNLSKKTEKYTDLIWKQLEEEPDNPRYNYQAGIAFIDKRRFDLALKYFLRALKADPDYPGIFADIAKVHVELGDVPKAIRFFNMALAKNRKDIASMNNLGVIYLELGKTDVAKRLLRKAFELDPENKAVMTNLGKLEEKLKK
jgi:glycosyltransferase involved in cell wall biosynthesis